MIENTLNKEFQYYLDNQSDLVDNYSGKFVVIKNMSVIGVYDTEIEAYKEASSTNELGTFLIQLVESGTENYTQTFYSQVSF